MKDLLLFLFGVAFGLGIMFFAVIYDIIKRIGKWL